MTEMVSILELIDMCRQAGGRDWALQAVFSVIGILRTWEQMEATTFEGDAEAVKRWTDDFGEPSEASIASFLGANPAIAALHVPVSIVKTWAAANAEESTAYLEGP